MGEFNIIYIFSFMVRDFDLVRLGWEGLRILYFYKYFRNFDVGGLGDIF